MAWCGGMLTLLPGRTLREITTLRDPAERMISHYNFWMNVLEKRGEPLPTFEEWYADEPRNYQTHWLARNYLQLDVKTLPESRILDEVSRLLDSFWLVCTLRLSRVTFSCSGMRCACRR